MAKKASKPIPDGYHTLTPYLVVRGGAGALDFYKKAFGAEELFRVDAPGGRIGHAEIRIGDSIVMLADETGEPLARGPQALGGTSVSLVVYVADVDAVWKRAVDAGAKVERPLENKFYGDRSGCVSDPFGHVWVLSTHVEDLTPDEIAERAKTAT